jgi:Na+/melibiose symporter-like transporter
MAEAEETTPEARARKRAKSFTGLLWHIGTFVVINAFLWILDIVAGAPGVQWAYWITIFWGIGLAFHVLAYLIDDSGVEEHKYQKFLAEEQKRQASDS